MPTERNRKVRERAYGLWVAGGHQDGKSDEHWVQAEREIDAEERPAEATTGRKTAAAGKAATGAAGGAGGAAPKKAAKPGAAAATAKPDASAKAPAARKEPSAAMPRRSTASRHNGAGAAKH